VVLTPLFDLIDITARHGRLEFDFARFDRFVRLFEAEGLLHKRVDRSIAEH